MPFNHLILCCPLLLLPSIFPSISVFSNESALHIRWPRYWSFSFSISPSNEYSGLISFRMDWLDPLAVQGILKSLLQHHWCSKASVLQHSAFFIVQLSHPYMTTRKTIALTRWTFVGKVTSLLFNMLSSLVITFLPRSNRLFISWLQSSSAVILEPPKIKPATISTVSPSICHEVMVPDAMIFVFWMLSFKSTFSLSSFTFNKRLFCSSSLSAIRVVSSAYLRLLIFLPAILIPACASSSPAFLMMHSAYKLNKQGDNIQPWRTPFPLWNQSVEKDPMHVLQQSVPPTLQKATTDPRLRRRLLEASLDSLLWGHCNFLWVLVHKVLLCPPRVYFPVLCKFWQRYGGVNGDLLQEDLCHSHTQRPCPCGRPLPTHTSTGDAQTQFCLSLCQVPGSWSAQGFFEPS